MFGVAQVHPSTLFTEPAGLLTRTATAEFEQHAASDPLVVHTRSRPRSPVRRSDLQSGPRLPRPGDLRPGLPAAGRRPPARHSASPRGRTGSPASCSTDREPTSRTRTSGRGRHAAAPAGDGADPVRPATARRRTDTAGDRRCSTCSAGATTTRSSPTGSASARGPSRSTSSTPTRSWTSTASDGRRGPPVARALTPQSADREPPPSTRRRERQDRTDSTATPLITDPAAQKLAIENAEAADPIEPTDSTEPTEPIDSTEPRQPMQSTDPSDQSERMLSEPPAFAIALDVGELCPLPVAPTSATPAGTQLDARGRREDRHRCECRPGERGSPTVADADRDGAGAGRNAVGRGTSSPVSSP